MKSSFVDSKMALVFRLLLFLIHCIISLRDAVVFIYHRLMHLGHWKRKPASVAAIRGNVGHLRKLPVHLAIVVVEDDLNVVDIAKIVVWAMAAGISYITIYDHKGLCKKNADMMFRKLQEEKEQLEENGSCNKYYPSGHCTGSREFPSGETSHTLNGGYVPRSPNIQIVGPEDGRQHLINITKRLGCQLASREITLDDINVPLVDAAVHGKNSIPDPDLVMKFGSVDSLLGFLPWQTRLSEILSLPTHRHIDFTSFFAALNRYGYTEQRCGK